MIIAYSIKIINASSVFDLIRGLDYYTYNYSPMIFEEKSYFSSNKK